MKVLGVHIGHDSSAALVDDAHIVACAAEERFVRIKHYAGLLSIQAPWHGEDAWVLHQSRMPAGAPRA